MFKYLLEYVQPAPGRIKPVSKQPPDVFFLYKAVADWVAWRQQTECPAVSRRVPGFPHSTTLALQNCSICCVINGTARVRHVPCCTVCTVRSPATLSRPAPHCREMLQNAWHWHILTVISVDADGLKIYFSPFVGASAVDWCRSWSLLILMQRGPL